VVAAFDWTRNVESPTTASRRDLRTWLALILGGQIWPRSNQGLHLGCDWHTNLNPILSYWQWHNKPDNKSQLRVKADHIKVDKADPVTSRNWIKRLHSSKGTIFPLGIKMQLVQELCLLTKPMWRLKQPALQTTQQCFLAHMDSCRLWKWQPLI